MTEAPFWERPENLTQQDLILHWQRVNSRRQIPMALLENARLERYDDRMFGDMVLSLTSYVLGEKLPEHTETATGSVCVEYPATWWQHAKHQYRERWWIRALARRRPPVMRTETKTGTLTATWHHMALYPWAQYIRKTPERYGVGDAVRISWLESSRSGGMFR